MRISYYEDRAILTVYEEKKAYYYRDVPLCVARKVMLLAKKGIEGKVWEIINHYPLVKPYQ